jgi:hypothetical protein
MKSDQNRLLLYCVSAIAACCTAVTTCYSALNLKLHNKHAQKTLLRTDHVHTHCGCSFRCDCCYCYCCCCCCSGSASYCCWALLLALDATVGASSPRIASVQARATLSCCVSLLPLQCVHNRCQRLQALMIAQVSYNTCSIILTTHVVQRAAHRSAAVQATQRQSTRHDVEHCKHCVYCVCYTGHHS